MKTKLTLTPIGVIRSPFKECKDMPIQPTMAQGIVGSVEILTSFYRG